MSLRLKNLSSYDFHKVLINEYLLTHKGATELLKRDTSKDKRDIDVIRENHQFLWEEKTDLTWEQKLAKKYYDKLFKEYCISDLTRYKENKVGLRWQTEQELVDGKGQFICGNKKCSDKEGLKTWEVNFSYIEQGEKKSALVKLRLCPPCSIKLNFHHKRKEVKRLKKKKKVKNPIIEPRPSESSTSQPEAEPSECGKAETPAASSHSWGEEMTATEEKSRDEEFEEYLEDLFL